MMWFILYLLAGVGLSFLFRLENDKFAITHPGYAFVIIAAWSLLVVYFACKVTTFRYKGKVIWQRKR